MQRVTVVLHTSYGCERGSLSYKMGAESKHEGYAYAGKKELRPVKGKPGTERRMKGSILQKERNGRSNWQEETKCCSSLIVCTQRSLHHRFFSV